MRSQRDREKYISLRAEGLSIEKAAARIGISKRSGIEWEKRYRDRIKQIHDSGLDALMEELRISKRDRMARLGNQLNDIDDEMTRRDLKSLEVGALLDYKIKLIECVNKLSGDDTEKRDDVIHALILNQVCEKE